MLRKAYSDGFYVIFLAPQQYALPFLNYNPKLSFFDYHISSQDLLLANSTMARHVYVHKHRCTESHKGQWCPAIILHKYLPTLRRLA